MKRVFKKHLPQAYFRAKHIVMVSMLLSLLLISSQLKAADSLRYVSGVVQDAKTKMPIASAQIMALNVSSSATTDGEGKFKIEISEGTEVLLVKAFDYNSREISVKGRESIVIDLYSEVYTPSVKEVQNVQGKENQSYSANSIVSVDNFENEALISVDQILQTKLGGAIHSVSRSGNLGVGNSISVRGINSIHRNNQPLIVVDGVIWENYNDVRSLHDGFVFNPLNNINIDDIKSVSVLKDGTAIYGSKGSNGVILIQTRRGEGMVTKIEVNASGGIIEKPKSIPTLNVDEFRLFSTDLLGSIDRTKIMEMFGQSVNELDFLDDNPSSFSYKTYHNNTDWNDEVYQTALFQNYNISVNGGDDRALYGFSVGYTSSEGLIKGTDIQRFNTRFNADFNLSKAVNVGMDISLANVDRFLLDDGVNSYSSVSYLSIIKSPFLNPYRYTVSGTLSNKLNDSDVFGVGNPTALVKDSYNTDKHYRFNVAIAPEFKISPVLTLGTKFDYSLVKDKESFYTPPLGVKNIYLEGLGVSENVSKDQVIRTVGLFSDTQLKYSNTFNNRHRINGIAGWRYISSFLELDYVEGHNSGTYHGLFNETAFRVVNGINNREKSMSTYANIDYSFDHRYFLTAGVAVDGSSKFGSETKGGFQLFDRSWGVFPSLQGAWLISSEEFMAGLNAIDQLKLRGGVTMTGNDDIDPYAWSTYFVAAPYSKNIVGIEFGNLANQEIQWESNTKFNVGLDVTLFNDRLDLSADVYQSTTKDLLLLKDLPEVAGTGKYWTNEGEMSNEGFEVSANLKVLNLKSFKWEMGASVGHYKNEIKSLPSGSFTTEAYGGEILTSVGNAAGLFYGYKTNGVISSLAEAGSANLSMINEEGETLYFGAGDMRFEEVVKDGVLDDKDKQIIGDPNPDVYGSFNSSFHYKNLSLDAFFTFSYGNDVYNYLRANLESGSQFYNQSDALLNRWVVDGQETEQPKVSYGDPMGNARFSDRWIEDGSYLKLKTLTMSYKIPLSGNGAIKGLKVWASAHNLWTLTEYLGLDPEVSHSNSVLFQGIDRGLLPSSKSYFVGVKLNL